MKRFIYAVALLAAIAFGGSAYPQWTSYRAPGSPWTNHTGPNGETGSTYQAPGSPWSNTTINGPGGSTNCTTYRAPGSPFATTNCN